jgi:hypothetical protein
MTFQYLAVLKADGGAARQPTVPYRALRQDLGRWQALLLWKRDWLDLPDLDRTAAMLSHQARLAIGVYMEMNDWGYCVGASDGDVDFRVVVNEPLADLEPEGKWALEQCVAAAGSPAWKDDAAGRVQRWAAKVPYEATAKEEVHAEEVLEVLNSDAPFADDPLDDLTRMLGIPSVRWPLKHEWPFE